MSKVIKTTPVSKLGIKDTDFLLKLIGRSTFEGSEIEQAYTVIKKISELHRSNLET
ncbi:MAG: hypothetical protein Unbinned6224contig1001_38 [Prokaryotic dsDNA virus sp.]|nr:MAG: hypothetical protein Unbinned6224contig1001_38 [Prokaryotic dsDNA virus sp.]|tara:strand:- start:17334 stop:17501 length:168 start_codon:yes stop_codon:yes gene_type:complete